MRPSSPEQLLTSQDRAWLEGRGISWTEARRQLELLAAPPAAPVIDRPCARGDGIEVLGERQIADLRKRHEKAALEGRLLKFVPASGLASRMFAELLAHRDRAADFAAAHLEADVAAGRAEALAFKMFLDGLRRFAFHADLEQLLSREGSDLDRVVARGPYAPLLDALLTERGLGYALRPKGLVKFHRYDDGARTPFEEHLVEAARLIRDRNGTCRLHVTVPQDHEASFVTHLNEIRSRYETRLGVTFKVDFSTQRSSTDTLSIDADGLPLRDLDGRLVLRPSGHGALLPNLDDLKADVVLIKNIDNVAPDRLKEPTYTWASAITGRLVELQSRIHELALRLEIDDAGARPEAESLARDLLGWPGKDSAPTGLPRGARQLVEILDRPIRVCGVVPNRGEPGGAPFWVRDPDGSTRPRLVESAEVDAMSSRQMDLFAKATHFNPVFMACGLRNRHGISHALRDFADESAVIVTKKRFGGKEIKVLERPGLWNGAMAGWHTFFVEVPLDVFNPVKTVNDLLRAEHQ